MLTNITVQEVVIDGETLYGVFADTHLLPITHGQPYASRRSVAEYEAAYKRQNQYRIQIRPDGYHCQFRQGVKRGGHTSWCHRSTKDNQYAIFPSLSAAKHHFASAYVADADVSVVNE